MTVPAVWRHSLSFLLAAALVAGSAATLHELPAVQAELPPVSIDRQLTSSVAFPEHRFVAQREAPTASISELKAGLDARTIEVVRRRGAVEGLPPREAIVIRLGREVFAQRRVQPETYAEAEQLLGRRALVSLTAVMASYAGTAVLLTVFDQQLPPGVESTLPLP